MTGGGGLLIVKVNVAVPVPLLLTALKLSVEVPAAVGVPEINPVPVLTDKPAGKPVTPKLVGEFVAAIWYEKTTPTVPPALVALVMTGGGLLMVKVNVAVPV